MGIYYISNCNKNVLKSSPSLIIAPTSNMAAEPHSKVKVDFSKSVTSTWSPLFWNDNFRDIHNLSCEARSCLPASLLALLGRKGAGPGSEAAATNQRPRRRKIRRVMLKNRHVGILSVWNVSKRSLFTTVEETVGSSQKNTFTSLFCFFSSLLTEEEDCVFVCCFRSFRWSQRSSSAPWSAASQVSASRLWTSFSARQWTLVWSETTTPPLLPGTKLYICGLESQHRNGQDHFLNYSAPACWP